jgi:hypothetical protein
MPIRAPECCTTWALGGALLVLIVAALTRDWRWLIGAPVVGYACAWTGHFVFERNKPETFGHPFWSLYSDFRMLALFLTGRLAGERMRALNERQR